ncbi:MAG: hypothetical protein ABEJ23_01705 [Haloarculaceae archaeon]
MGEFEPTAADGGVDETVVYLAASDDDQMECAARLRGEVEGENRRLLVFSALDDVHDLDEIWDRYVGEDLAPEAVAIVEATPGGTDVEQLTSESGTPIHVLGVDPSDLTGIAIAVTRVTKEWEGHPISVCFRDVDVLLRYHDDDTVFKFLNSALASLDGTGARVHAHLRPQLMESRQAHAIASLFDRVEGDESLLE